MCDYHSLPDWVRQRGGSSLADGFVPNAEVQIIQRASSALELWDTNDGGDYKCRLQAITV